MEAPNSLQGSVYAVLSIQILTLIFQFVTGLVAQIGKNKLEQIQAMNEINHKKIDDLHKASSSQGGSNIT